MKTEPKQRDLKTAIWDYYQADCHLGDLIEAALNEGRVDLAIELLKIEQLDTIAEHLKDLYERCITTFVENGFG